MTFEVFDNMIDPVLVVDRNHLVIYANQSMLQLCGIPAGRVLGKRKVAELFDFEPPFIPEDLTQVKDAIPYQEVQLVSRTHEGAPKNRVQVTLQPVGKDSGHWIMYAHDVTLEERLQEKYRGELESKEKLIIQLDRKLFETELLYEISRDVNFQETPEEVMGFVLDRLERSYVFRSSAVLIFDQNEKSLKHLVLRKGGAGELVSLALGGWDEILNAIGTTESPVFYANGSAPNLERFIGSLLRSPVSNFLFVPLRGKESIGAVLLMNALDEKWAENNKNLDVFSAVGTQMILTVENFNLYQKSIRDGLTRLYNASYFNDRLGSEIKRAKRSGNPLSLVLLDVDFFKKFNDTYGHQIGDQVLQQVAEIVQKTCRESDLACRYGGEEFVVIMPNTDQAGALAAAERVRRAIESTPLVSERGELKITASFGVSTYPLNTEDKAELLQFADLALYAAKASGRNRVHAFSDELCERKSAHIS